jgi:hypothetical protein
MLRRSLLDLGVYYAATGNRMLKYVTGARRRASTPRAQMVSTSFFTGDISSVVSISYVYTDAQGKTVTINNNFMGYTPTFIGTFYQQRNTQGGTGQLTLRLNQCVSNHLSIPSRIDDYAIQDFDFSAFSSGANVIGTISTSE